MTARWLLDAACAGDQPARWFDPVDVDDDGRRLPLDEAGLAYCRAKCLECPVRFECLEQAMDDEDGSADQFRFGVRAMTTPQQRASLWRRGKDSWRCAECGLAYDPAQLITGLQVCGCSTKVSAPVSDLGDAWSDRHTALAQRVIAWVMASFDPGAEVPSPTAYAKTAGIRKDDCTRVWRALVEDGVLTQSARGRYQRVGGASAGLRTRGRARSGWSVPPR